METSGACGHLEQRQNNAITTKCNITIITTCRYAGKIYPFTEGAAVNDHLISKICEELTAERVLTKQVIDHLASHHEVTTDTLSDYFKRVRETTTVEIDGVEDYEIDLTFSPLFTPRLHDRAKYSRILDTVEVKHEDIETIVDDVMKKKLEACFREHDDIYCMPLHEVLVRRYIRLLNLATPLSKKVKQVIENSVPENIQDIVKALARDPVWLPGHRQDFLAAFLKIFKEKKNFSVDKLDYLTDFVRTYRPASILDVDRQFGNLIEACLEDIHKLQGGHYLYYHDLIERHYMGSESEKDLSEKILHEKEREISLAMELKLDFAHILKTQTDYIASVRDALAFSSAET